MRVGFIILNYKALERSINCINSLVNNKISESDIVFVDNSESDKGCKKVAATFNAIQTICSGGNLGYAGGNNLGIKLLVNLGYEFFVIINNDCTVLETSFLKQLPLLPASVGIFGLNISDSVVYKNVKVRDSFFYRSFFKANAPKVAKKNEVYFTRNYVAGAGIILSRAVVEKIGLLEERYFLYCEEIDYCYKAQSAGFSVVQDSREVVSLEHERGKSHDRPYVWYYLSRNIFNIIRFNHAGRKHYLTAVLVILNYIVKSFRDKENENKFHISYLIVRGCIDGLIRKKYGREENV